MENIYTCDYKNGKITLFAEWEHETVAGNFDDADTVKWVLSEIAKDNLAAWFCCKVEFSVNDIVLGVEYLGACSYESFEDFYKEENGYFSDMCETAYQNAIETLTSIQNKLKV